MIDKIFILLNKFSTHLDNVFFPKKRKEKKSVKIVNVIVIVKICYMPIGTMAIFVLVITANIKDFMRRYYGIFTYKTRMFIKKVIWFCLAAKNKIYFKTS